ncbi:hypothetical protein CDD82_1173 [Ophiocordyceps australis]|uniref:Protein kinase domain-containing protein n=1 Tax=Ophiocordyceps australis TaxID=1399860 RepID=A0A2C5XPA6_9HYPO|nr:hypothetical protein CDD82_1173 [Ophiocordyceps australis]
MTSYVFRSAYSASSSTPPWTSPESPPQQTAQSTSHGSFAAFVCHAAHLEEKLRPQETVFAGRDSLKTAARTRIGQGTSFIVERLEVGDDEGEKTTLSRHKVVVVKTVRQDPLAAHEWRGILLEMSVLLHEPIRYHPNIVRLLDVWWNATGQTASPFPALVQEYAEFGTLDRLQADVGALAFGIKQKLCYDVGRGLSILHACGIVHGDLKHENVLVFANRYPQPADQPYTAKVADFGGTLLAPQGHDEGSTLPMYTFPYEAPEAGDRLTGDAAKKTDAFSYGMLVWRCMLDGDDVLAAMGFAIPRGGATSELRAELKRLKQTDELLEAALVSLARHRATCNLPRQSLGLVMSCLRATLCGDASQRALDRAQARMRGMSSMDAHDYVIVKNLANAQRKLALERKTPGAHGIDMDSVGYALGRSAGDDYDAQNNLPGYRPDLSSPDQGGAVFDPETLRRVLDWAQQEAMVGGLVDAARGAVQGLSPYSAAYFLFQSHLNGFGVAASASEACRWLRVAAAAKEERESVECRATAWVVRVHEALNEANPLSWEEKMEKLCWAATWGHVGCGGEARQLLKTAGSRDDEAAWTQRVDEAEKKCRALTSGTGMPIFIARRLTRKWDTRDVDEMDALIQQELGSEYEAVLKKTNQDSQGPTKQGRFDAIHVNNKGYGLLHLVASQGNLPMLAHLMAKYACDINVANHSHADSPLTCACRTAHLACALHLLRHGADANGPRFAQEAPLHCISRLPAPEMRVLVAALLAAGADLERPTNAARRDVRAIWADWQGDASIQASPLARAVLNQSVDAVRVLLDHGASPAREENTVQPMALAAVLTQPEMLQILLDAAPVDTELFDEVGMLEAARGGGITPYDSLSLQSRLVRCGPRFKDNLSQTLRILQQRAALRGGSSSSEASAAQLCREICLGNRDIVETLLRLGHSPLGAPHHRPVAAAVAMNDLPTLRLLHDRGADLTMADEPLFIVLATRPQTSPRGIAVATHLLAAGVDPDARRADGPSALCLAIKNRFFDLADLLVSRCSLTDVNARHAWSDGQAPETLLCHLVATHSFSHLLSIEYLAKAHAEPSLRLRLGLGASRISPVHVLAQHPPRDWNTHSQISDRILHHVLTIFPDPESLQNHHVDAVIGTPLTAAVLAANHHMVTTLLDSPYRIDADTPVALQYTNLFASPVAETATARALALTLATDAVASPQPPCLSQPTTRVEIALELNPDSTPHLTAMLEKHRAAMHQPLPPPAPSDNMPVDLSIISEEKPTAWQQGDQMTEQDATRTFLNAFRRSEGIGDAVTVTMDKTFNKRPLEASTTAAAYANR